MSVATETARAARTLIDQANTAAKFLMAPVFNVAGYGAKGDGVHDDTQAFADAIADIPSGARLFIPPGSFLLSGSGAQLILVDKPIHIMGSGFYSQLIIKATVPGTTDVIRVKPKAVGLGEFITIENLLVIPASGLPARHGINLDTTDAGITIDHLLIQNLYIRPMGGRAIASTNPTNNDGFFLSTIRNCELHGGIMLSRSGDSLIISENKITGANCGVEVTAVDGAYQLMIERNNITSTGGAVRVINAGQTKIRDNQIEQIAPTTSPVDALISVEGTAINPLDLAEITGNNIHVSVAAGGSVGRNVRVQYTRDFLVENNRIARSAGGKHIDILAGAANTRVGFNAYFDANDIAEAPVIADAGMGTMGVAQAVTLQNSWVNYGTTFYAGAAFLKDGRGIVRLQGVIKNGTVTTGILLFTLPVGFRPPLNTKHPVLANSNGTPVHGEIEIATDGTVKLQQGSNTYLSLEGVTFQAG